MKLPKPSLSVTSLTAAIVAFTVVFGVLVLPVLKQLGRSQAAIEAIRQQPVSIPKNTNSSTTNQGGRNTKELVQVLLPENENQYDVSVQIEALAKQVGVNLTSLTFTTEATTPKTSTAQPQDQSGTALKKLTFALNATGTYAQVQQLVIGLTTLDRFIQVDQLKVSSDADKSSGQAGAITLQLTGFAYYLPTSK